ncbi:MAG TPA: zinc ribbon domain-containing protein [Casimicrobiaceae bacterium]|jgi:putative FmdB family regulatory protein|nr:zinc ribbon domain-containing protein [Casimicrobiaceae bacterium]
MPIYEYACSLCGHELEALQKLADARLVTCPACHADALVKKVSAAGFQLKGSGWYVTDFRNGSKPAAKAGEGAAKDKAADAASAPAAEASTPKDSATPGGDTAAPAKATADTTTAKPASPASPSTSTPSASS